MTLFSRPGHEWLRFTRTLIERVFQDCAPQTRITCVTAQKYLELSQSTSELILVEDTPLYYYNFWANDAFSCPISFLSSFNFSHVTRHIVAIELRGRLVTKTGVSNDCVSLGTSRNLNRKWAALLCAYTDIGTRDETYSRFGTVISLTRKDGRCYSFPREAR